MRNVIDIALKLQFFAAKSQKSPSGWGLCPQDSSVVRLSCIGLFGTGPNWTIFVQKKQLLVQASSQQNPGCAFGRIHSCRQIFQAIISAADENS